MNHIHLKLIKRIVLGVVALATVYLIWLGICVWYGVFLPTGLAAICTIVTGILSAGAYNLYDITYDSMVYEEEEKRKALDAAVEEILRSKP